MPSSCKIWPSISFFAGKDTSSFVLSWFVVMMNRYPDVLRKIREEIREQLPELLSGEIDAPSMEQLGRLQYLEAAIRENLRLNTSMTTRSPNQDTTLNCGTFIPKNSMFYVCHYASAKDYLGRRCCRVQTRALDRPGNRKITPILAFQVCHVPCGATPMYRHAFCHARAPHDSCCALQSLQHQDHRGSV